MKKIFKSALAIFIGLCMLFSAAACSQNGQNDEKTTPTPSQTDENVTPGEDYTEGGKFVDYNHETVDPSIKLQAYNLTDKTVTYLTSAGYTAVDISKFDALRDVYGITIEPVLTSPNDHLTKFIALCMGDETPDITHMGNKLSMISAGYLQSWDSYIDVTTNLWKDLESSFANIRINGGIYTINERPGRWDFVWYNKDIFEQYGLATPKELLEQGNWNWNTFRDAAIALTVDEDSDGVPEIYGAHIQNGLYLVYSAGTAMVSLNGDGTVSNNVRSEPVARAIEFYTQLHISDNVLYDGSDAPAQFGAGKIAMLWNGLWVRINFTDLIKSGAIDFVPIPKDPQTDKYYIYQRFPFYVLPTQSANPEGAAAWMNAKRYNTFVVDLEAREEYLAMSASEQVDALGWTVEMDDYLWEEFYGNLDYVPVESTYTDFNLGQFFGDFFFRPLLGEPWSAIAEELYPKINDEIESVLQVD